MEDKNKEIKQHGWWISANKKNYKNNTQCMKTNNDIKNTWKNFIEKYKEYLRTFEEIWFDNLEKVKEYIELNNKSPPEKDKNTKVKQLGKWIMHNKQNYKNNTDCMKNNNDIKTEWEKFIEKYKEYLRSVEEIWFDNLEKAKEYIELNNKSPSQGDKNTEVKQMAKWICTNKTNYKNNRHCMKNNDIKNAWEKFIEKYKEYLRTYEEIWFDNLEKVEEYIDLNNKLPSQGDKNTEVKQLRTWICSSKTNYKNNTQCMKNNDIKIKTEWEKFIEKYKEYFKS